jgi:predicted nucleotidyltransferase
MQILEEPFVTGSKLKSDRGVKTVMRPSEVLPLHREMIRQLVFESGMANPRVFGSVLHGDDEDGSDLDLLVDPAPRTSLLDLAGLQIEIEERTGIKVDLLTPGFLPVKFRQKVLDEAQPV